MTRTTILLPLDLKKKTEGIAREKGISMGEYIRILLDQSIAMQSNSMNKDPFFSDKAVFTTKAPKDLAKNHDAYLYGSSF
ncbi:MAG: hypothetical protein KBA66_13910 [Leptospiraceae bacterium]|nr:hypothetical protein [Leptospiraceae bacterium]